MRGLQNIIELTPLKEKDCERFIRDGQRAFLHGTGEVCRRQCGAKNASSKAVFVRDIRTCIEAEGSETCEIMVGDASVGGVVIHPDSPGHGSLDLLYVAPCAHGCGIGSSAWRIVEQTHPEIQVWETIIPALEERNRHFLVRRCGFHVIGYYKRHYSPTRAEKAIPMALNVADDILLIRLEKTVSYGGAAKVKEIIKEGIPT